MKISLDDDLLQASLETALQKYNVKLTESKKLAEYVIQLSDFYIQNPTQETPWANTWAQIAYLVYFHPFNHARGLFTVERGNQVKFFDGFTHAIDYGAGLGSASGALQKLTEIRNFLLIEKNQKAAKMLNNDWTWTTQYEDQFLKAPDKTLAVFSYSYTELNKLPNWAYDCEGIMILEPATAKDGRRLLELRKQLITAGFSIWAPCLHQQECPLLKHSKTDWCHDRAHIEAPKWSKAIENYLPFKNQTITTSYLLARKKKPTELKNMVRLTGDHQKEKGKSKQMICRSDAREFLSWLERAGDAPVYPRGDLLEMPEVKVVGAELRVQKKN